MGLSGRTLAATAERTSSSALRTALVLREHWDARAAADQARSRAAKLKARLDKLRRVAADLERAGAGAG